MSGKGSNVLPLWGNEKTMNLNNMILTNIQASPYFKVQLFDLKTYHEVIDEIFYKVTHLEPWEKGSRKLSGQTGMCGGVRGVGAGGIVSSAFCLLYKLYTLKLTRKQLTGLLNHGDSPYIRGLGFMYVRYTQPPQDLWDWMEPYMEDDEEIDVKAGGGCVMTIGEMCREFLVKLDWYSALFPRIPVPIQKDLDVKLRSLPPPPRAAGAAGDVAGGDEEEEAQNGGSTAWGNRERAEGVDRSATDDDRRDNGHRRPIPAARSPPRRERREKSPDGHKHHGRRPESASSRGDDDDYKRALEREKERQRKLRHASPSARTSPHRSAESRDRRKRSRSHDKKHGHRSSSGDRRRERTPSRDKSGRKDRPRSRDRSLEAKDRSKRSHSRDRSKRRRSSSTERHSKKASSRERDRHGDSRGTAYGSSKSRRSPAKDDRSPIRDREARTRYEQKSPSDRQERDRSRSADARKKRKVSRSHSREREYHGSRARSSDSPRAKD